ncbi:MAG: right-handed parallel beta-helix repeat-containing protein [bacterium]
MKSKCVLFLLALFASKFIYPQEFDPKYYDVGNPVTREIWVDPVNGNDDNDGSTRAQALLTLMGAWYNVPANPSSTGIRIMLTAGEYAYRDEYTNDIVGLYLDDKSGTYEFPIIFEAADGAHSVRFLSSLDFRNVRYVYLIGLDFDTELNSVGGGNTIHFAASDHILIKNCIISGFDGTTRKPQETLKVNQTSYMYVEDSDISGAFWFALDFVAVQYGHIRNCRVHDASEDALLLKGGSSQISVEGNFIYNANRFGFSAGQGSGFDFFVYPWLHYEAYDIKFVNNVVHNTGYAGIAFLGAYNVLCAYNTLYKIGINPEGDRTLISVNLGQRGCDGAAPDTCYAHHMAGGWSPGPWSDPSLESGTETDCIPNRNVFVYNNIFYNPYPVSTIGPHIEVRAPYDASEYSDNFLTSSNIAKPALSDDRLKIAGNIIWNGSVDKSLGIDEYTGCQDSNPDCNRSQLMDENLINAIEPEFVDASNLNFHPEENGNLFQVSSIIIPDFAGNDKPDEPLIPTGNLNNTVARDMENNSRATPGIPGAYSNSVNTGIESDNHSVQNFELFQNYPNPFNPITTIKYSISPNLPLSPFIKGGSGEAEGDLVTLIVYDILGNEVATLVNETKEPGVYQVEFDGGRLPSGVYFYKLTAGSFSSIKKLLLLK